MQQLRRIVVAFLLWSTSALAAEGFDVRDWVKRPGVKLVAVEFYATWCQPCMDAVPKWQALAEKYRRDGLRLIVVATRDPDSQCAAVNWTPDKQVCDLDGFVADQFGVGSKLPSAFLWSWDGRLLVKNGHVDDVAAAVERFLSESPRVAVEVVAEQGKVPAELDALIRSDLARSGKLTVVSSGAELEALRTRRKETHDVRKSEKQKCELGEELAANSWLKATVFGEGKSRRLGLVLLNLETGCQSGLTTVRLDPSAPEKSVAEAVGGLLEQLSGEVVPPTSKGMKSAPKKPVGIDLGDMATLREAQALATALEEAERREKLKETSPDYRIAGWEAVLALKVQGQNPQAARAKERIEYWRALVARREQLKKDLDAAQELATMTILTKTEKLAGLDALLAKYAADSTEPAFRALERLRSWVASAPERTAASDAPRKPATPGPTATAPSPSVSRPGVSPGLRPDFTSPGVTSSSGAGMSSGRVAAWSMLVTGMVGVGVGVGCHLTAISKRDEVKSAEEDGVIPLSAFTMKEVEAIQDEADTLANVGLAGYIVGGAGLLTSLILFLATPATELDSALLDGPTLRPSVSVDSFGATLWLGGEF